MELTHDKTQSNLGTELNINITTCERNTQNAQPIKNTNIKLTTNNLSITNLSAKSQATGLGEKKTKNKKKQTPPCDSQKEQMRKKG